MKKNKQMCTLKDKHMMYGSWDMECNGHNFLSIWAIFCPFASPPTNIPKNQHFDKMKKMPGDIIILPVYHIWQSHDIWFLGWGGPRTGFFVILDHFLSFTPLTKQNVKILKIWKKKMPGDTVILHQHTKNHDMLYRSWDIGHGQM